MNELIKSELTDENIKKNATSSFSCAEAPTDVEWNALRECEACKQIIIVAPIKLKKMFVKLCVTTYLRNSLNLMVVPFTEKRVTILFASSRVRGMPAQS